MKLACVDALARLARVPPPETVTAAYGVEELRFGPDYLIPKPFDTAADRRAAAGRGQGRHGHRRRDPAARRPRASTASACRSG